MFSSPISWKIKAFSKGTSGTIMEDYQKNNEIFSVYYMCPNCLLLTKRRGIHMVWFTMYLKPKF